MKIFRRSSSSCRAVSYSRGVGLPVCFCAVVLFFTLCLVPGAARAQMSPLNNEDLRGITGQAGVSLNLDGGAQVYFNLLKFSDSQSTPNWIELHDVTVDNGAGGNFYFSTRYDTVPVYLVTSFTTHYSADPIKSNYTWALNQYEILSDPLVQNGTIPGLEEGMRRLLYPIIYDVGTNSSGETFISVRDTSSLNPRWYSVGNFVFNAYNITNSVALSNAAAAAIASPGLPAGYSLSVGFNVNNPSSWTASDWATIQAIGPVALSNAAAAGIASPGLPVGYSLSAGFIASDLSTWSAEDWAAITAIGTTDILDAISYYQTTYQTTLNAISNYQATIDSKQNQALGSIKLDALRQGPSFYRLWAHAGQGISFDYQTTISADALTYAYNNTATGVLKFSNIHIAGSATGNPADPYDLDLSGDPWVFSENFKIGTIGDTANAPATMDVGTDSGGVTSVYMSLPAAGSIRVAEVNFGGNNFGPIAIDGIQFHRLDIKLTP